MVTAEHLATDLEGRTPPALLFLAFELCMPWGGSGAKSPRLELRIRLLLNRYIIALLGI